MADHARRLEALEGAREEAPSAGGAWSAGEGRNERSVDHEMLVVVGGFPEETRALRMEARLRGVAQEATN
eukprot:10843110-Prorocentrum_lima.AAC.1